MRKLGLLMMTRGEVPFADLWEDWLHGAAGKCRIFVHAKVPDRITSSLFANAVIPEYVQTTHGRDYPHNAHLIGMLALLREALRHPDIAKLAFLSESCLPMRPFGLCYQRLMIDDRSWICDWPSKPPYPVRFHFLPPQTLAEGHFLVSPDWIALNRRHAELLLANAPQYLEAFRTVPAASEHYPASILSVEGVHFETETTRRGITYVDWTRGGPYEFHRVTETDLETMLASPFLFARKFPADSNIRRFWLRLMSDAHPA